jgi:hypothetical protein
MITFLKKDQDEVQPGRKDDAEGTEPDCKDQWEAGADFQNKVFPGIVIDAHRGSEKKDGEDVDSHLFWIVEEKIGSAEKDERGKKPEPEWTTKKVFDGRTPWIDMNLFYLFPFVQDFNFHGLFK